jgi:acyl-coenzyme A thioesterase PaaI-like protein
MPHTAIQDDYPDDLAHCYGCGRLNEHGLHIRSTWDGDETVATLTPRAEHTAIPGYVYGGLVASLIDCHGTGSAALAAYRAAGRDPAAEHAPAAEHRPAAEHAPAANHAPAAEHAPAADSAPAAAPAPAGRHQLNADGAIGAAPLRFVTASLHVDYLRPTPMGVPLEARGTIVEVKPRKVVVDVTVRARGEVRARGRVVAVLMPSAMLAG